MRLIVELTDDEATQCTKELLAQMRTAAATAVTAYFDGIDNETFRRLVSKSLSKTFAEFLADHFDVAVAERVKEILDEGDRRLAARPCPRKRATALGKRSG